MSYYLIFLHKMNKNNTFNKLFLIEVLYEKFESIVMTHHPILEACVETIAECIHALNQGADQLEVCGHMDLDGLTPDAAFVQQIIEEIKLPVKVMIRCRGGNFVYSQEEIEEMVASIKRFKAFSIHGFVFGALSVGSKNNITIDMSAMYRICREAAPFPVTMHKAIDSCHNITDEVAKLKSVSNIRFILSSGGQATASAGSEMLVKMQAVALPEIEIVAAGKITQGNLPDLFQKTHLRYYHGRSIV